MMIWYDTQFIMTVNQLVVGSIPTAGAIKIRGFMHHRMDPFFIWSSGWSTVQITLNTQMNDKSAKQGEK